MNTAFEHGLQARLLWMQVRSYGALGFHRQAGVLARKAYEIVEELAIYQARCDFAKPEPFDRKCPIILRDVQRLAELYEWVWDEEGQTILDELNEAEQYLEWQREQAEEKVKREQAATFAMSCIERNDWDALDLPSPEHLSAELSAGKPMRVDGHFLHYEDGVVWMDNPYGVEGCLGEEPTIRLCRQFLTRIAKGGMYGPEP